jgi:hypothetical protein
MSLLFCGLRVGGGGANVNVRLDEIMWNMFLSVLLVANRVRHGGGGGGGAAGGM